MFVHLTALTEMYKDIKTAADLYPPLKLSDDELDRIKLRIEPEYRDRLKLDKSFSEDGSQYNTYAFPEDNPDDNKQTVIT